MESRFSKLLQRLVALEEVFQGHLQEVSTSRSVLVSPLVNQLINWLLFSSRTDEVHIADLGLQVAFLG